MLHVFCGCAIIQMIRIAGTGFRTGSRNVFCEVERTMKTLTVHARIADYEKAAAFIEDWLHHCRLSEQIISENSLVFETLFNDILLKGVPEETEI